MTGIQCADCGLFCGEADFALGLCAYTPESEFTRERIEWTCRRCAQAIEAQRAETGTGSVHESAVGNADAPKE
jgi:hypothetical protein